MLKEYTENDVINTYKKLLNKEIDKLPSGLFKEDTNNRLKYIIRYLFLDKLKIHSQDSNNVNFISLLRSYKIYNILAKNKLTNDNLYGFFIWCIPEYDLQPWIFYSNLNRQYWENKDNIKSALTWLEKRLLNDNIIKDSEDFW